MLEVFSKDETVNGGASIPLDQVAIKRVELQNCRAQRP